MKRFLVGRNISLHAMSEMDIAESAAYFCWLDDLELDRYVGRSRFANNGKSHRDYFNRACSDRSLVVLGIYENTSGRHIGNISLKDLDWSNRRGWLGYMIGEKAFHGKGYATEAVFIFLLYAFQRLNLHRVHTTVSVFNVASISILRRVGLKEEGRFREHIVLGREHIDVLAFGALADEWMESHSKYARAYYEKSVF